MPNGGTHHCYSCKYYSDALCSLRNEPVSLPAWTMCMNRNRDGVPITGPMYAIVCEVKNKAGAYCSIPYYRGLRADTVQEDGGNTKVVWISDFREKLEFADVEAYMEFYETETMKNKKLILGAVIGDIIGSVFEWNNYRAKDFKLFCSDTDFTDDSVMTFATMHAVLNGTDFAGAYHSFGNEYPGRGYGGGFLGWLMSSDPKPYGSYGNGSAMRVSPVGWAYDTIDDVLENAKKSAEVTHNHPEGIKGAQATAAAVFLARTGSSKEEIKKYIETTFGYDLSRTCDEVRKVYEYDVSCQGTVPEAIIAFLDSTDYEDAIRNAISLGGDSDTLACITGGIAEAFYKEIPEYIIDKALGLLPIELIEIVEKFSKVKN